ncbi:MAG TPA: Rad52/Rad22 family DNA repair protein [Longimicrobium sp.]|nr:Rad52/Rad22 family DNA repair protein [Longimicrobium sp.]
MMMEINFSALRERFAADEIEWRLQQAGEKNGRVWALCVPYVTNRAIQSRLDEVVGPTRWKNEFRPGPDGGVMCGLSVRVGDEWITKWDGAENTDVEGVKGGLSSAMKRAAVQWGIGRYLYALDETFAQVNDNGKQRGKTKQGSDFRWDPPRLPAWALPSPEANRAAPAEAAAPAPVAEAAEPEPSAEHEAMLQYVRRVGPQVGDDAQIRINRRPRNLKEFVRENWAAIKEQPQIARAVVDAMRSATGTPFEAEREVLAAAA